MSTEEQSTSRTDLDEMMNQRTIDMGSLGNTNPPLPEEFGKGENYLNFVVPLYQAAMMGDWETAKDIFDQHRQLVGFPLNKNQDTPLHVVATAKETKQTINFVSKLVNMMTEDELKLTNKHSNTAFWEASASGKTKMAIIMMEKNSSLSDIRGKDDVFPLSISAKNGSDDLVKRLYKKSNKMSGNQWEDSDRDLTLFHSVENDMFDLAHQIVKDQPELARNVSLLAVLAKKSNALYVVERALIVQIIISTIRLFGMKVQYDVGEESSALKLLKIIWEQAMRTMNDDEIEGILRGPPTSLLDKTIRYSSRILFVAAQVGNTRLIVELLRTCPEHMLDTNEDGLTIFHIAVMHRYYGIYNLLYEIADHYKNTICTSYDNKGNNMLHLVGKTTKEMATRMSGALLMQREFTWFKEVERMMPSYLREAKNNDGQTPSELFSKESDYLVSKGLKLMKECMIVATLIITVAFSIVFTIPGGYEQDKGFPVFIHQRSFIIFIIADAVSLVTSSAAVMIFLSVLTSGADQLTLMDSLSLNVMRCLMLLAISIATLMVAFSCSFFILYSGGLTWIPVAISTFAIQPVTVFLVLNILPTWQDMFKTVNDDGYMFQPKKPMLYTTKRAVHI